AIARGEKNRLVVVCELRQRVDRMPTRVRGNLRVDAGRHEPEVCGCELPPRGVSAGLAQRLELLEVRQIAHVDLLRQVTARRLLERLRLCQRSPGQSPRPRVRLLRALPQQCLKL